MDLNETIFRKKLGARIKEFRTSKNLTQAELAARIGYKDFQSVARIENGRITTSIYNIYLISLALECSINELLDGINR